MLDRPVLVTGTPCAGKTRVTLCLATAPEFLYVYEPLMIWNIGKRDPTLDTRDADEAVPAVREAIVRECKKQLETAGKTRYVDDLSYHALRLSFVMEVLPNVRIIQCGRSVEDILPEMVWGWTHRFSPTEILRKRRKGIVLSSVPRLAWRFARNYVSTRLTGSSFRWGPQMEGVAEYGRQHGPVAGAAFQWSKMMERFTADLELVPEDRKLYVRFEDMLADPQTQLDRIGRFCEVEDLENLKEQGAAILNPRHPGPWVDISQEDWDRVRPMIDPIHQQQGYPPLPEEAPRCALRHREGDGAPSA